MYQKTEAADVSVSHFTMFRANKKQPAPAIAKVQAAFTAAPPISLPKKKTVPNNNTNPKNAGCLKSPKQPAPEIAAKIQQP